VLLLKVFFRQVGVVALNCLTLLLVVVAGASWCGVMCLMVLLSVLMLGVVRVVVSPGVGALPGLVRSPGGAVIGKGIRAGGGGATSLQRLYCCPIPRAGVVGVGKRGELWEW
jgi:hypothetical protein